MPDDQKKFLLVDGIDTAVSLKEMITCFQNASSVRFTVKRNMDPENLKAVLGTGYFLEFLDKIVITTSCTS